MRSVPVVAVDPDRQLAATFQGCLIDSSIGPLPECGLYEALGLAVGSGSEGSGAPVPDVQPGTSLVEELGGIAGPIVGHDALHGHAQALIVADGRLEEGDRAAGGLVRHHTDEADPGMVINGDMQIFPPRSRGVERSRVPPGHPMSGLRKAP